MLKQRLWQRLGGCRIKNDLQTFLISLACSIRHRSNGNLELKQHDVTLIHLFLHAVDVCLAERHVCSRRHHDAVFCLAVYANQRYTGSSLVVECDVICLHAFLTENLHSLLTEHVVSETCHKYEVATQAFYCYRLVGTLSSLVHKKLAAENCLSGSR